MSRKTPAYYWDSCVFIKAFQPGEPNYSTLREYLEKLKDSKIKIITSSITHTEAYQNNVIWKMRRLRNLQIMDATQPITIRAATIRDDTNLKTPDAIHLATALYAGVGEFHTYDTDFLDLHNAYTRQLPTPLTKPSIIKLNSDQLGLGI